MPQNKKMNLMMINLAVVVILLLTISAVYVFSENNEIGISDHSNAILSEPDNILAESSSQRENISIIPFSETIASYMSSSVGSDPGQNVSEADDSVISLISSSNATSTISIPQISSVSTDDTTELNVLDYGADNTGLTDNTGLLTTLHNSGKKIYYPNGTYRFNGKNLDLSGGVRFESRNGVVIRNNISDMNIIRFDDFGNLIGLMQNHLESKIFTDKSGSLVSPPLSSKEYDTKIDLIAYWYNDFGLNTRTGWNGWQTWSWNHHDVNTNPALADQNLNYNPSLHPLLGYYYGDDPVVLDWQSYWLYEYGVKNVALISTTLNDWEQPGARDHWVYQLVNNAPNFKNLNYTAFVSTPYGHTEDKIRDAWINIIEKLYSKHDNYYVYDHKGTNYPVINLFDEKALVTAFGSAEKVKSFYIEISNRFKDKGFNGIVMMTRNPISFNIIQSNSMNRENVIRFDCTYVANFVPSGYLSGQYSYSDLVDYFSPKVNNTVLGIATSMLTQSPHPSKWKCYGNSANEFERWLLKASDFLNDNPNAPQMLTCYNVSEWGEGGVGLIPTVQDGFSYLEAIRNVIIE